MLRFVWIVLLCCYLSACGGGKVAEPVIKQSLSESMANYFQKMGAPPSSQYLTHMNDLNSDGEQDALILMRSPYGYWCDTNGCPMFTVVSTPKGYTVISKTHPVRGPVCALNSSTGKWRDIVVRVAGRSARPKDVMLHNKGNGYPANPNDLTPIASSFKGQSLCAFQLENDEAYARQYAPQQSRFINMQSAPLDTSYGIPPPRQYNIGRRPPPYDPDYIPEMKEPIGNVPFVNEYDPKNH